MNRAGSQPDAPRQGWSEFDYMSEHDLAHTTGYAVAALRHAVRRDRMGPKGLQQFSANRRYSDWIANGETVLTHAPCLWTLYDDMRLLGQQACGKTLKFSPWTRSAISVKRCSGANTEHGWHVDYNDISVMLYLSEGEPLEVLAPTITPDTPDFEQYISRAFPKPGRVVVINGAEQFHRVPPHDAEIPRDTVVFNFYYESNQDPQRPAGLDDSLFSSLTVSM